MSRGSGGQSENLALLGNGGVSFLTADPAAEFHSHGCIHLEKRDRGPSSILRVGCVRERSAIAVLARSEMVKDCLFHRDVALIVQRDSFPAFDEGVALIRVERDWLRSL